MVDSQPDHHPAFAGLEPQAIIDHHPVARTLQIPFVDIRPRYGATATILVEYLRAAKIKPSTKLATGLYYAIKTDTSNFERQTVMEDLNAFQFVFPALQHRSGPAHRVGRNASGFFKIF